MRYVSLPKVRILAIDPRPRGFGYAVLESEPLQIVDWGIKHCRRNDRSCVQAVDVLIRLFLPTTMVMECNGIPSKTRESAVREFLDRIGDVIISHGVSLRGYSRREVVGVFLERGAVTKHEIAQILCAQFPELEPRLPKPRQIWDAEDVRMSIFGAVSLAVAHLEIGAR